MRASAAAVPIRLSKASVCRLLPQLGFSTKRPVWRAFLQNSELVERWANDAYPSLRALARQQQADILLGAEARKGSPADMIEWRLLESLTSHCQKRILPTNSTGFSFRRL